MYTEKKYYSCKNMHQVYLTYIYLFYHNNQLLYNLYIFITQTITFAKICIITEHRTCIFDIIYYHYHIILSSSLLLFNLFLSVNCIQHVFNSFYILIFKRLVTENKKSFLMNVKYTYPISIVSC